MCFQGHMPLSLPDKYLDSLLFLKTNASIYLVIWTNNIFPDHQTMFLAPSSVNGLYIYILTN